MKNLFYYPLLIIIPAGLIISAYSGYNTSRYPSGAPAGYTGSPHDGNNCTYCHNGNASTVTGWITSDVGPDGYIPGMTYNITVTVTGTGNKGFEVSPQDVEGNLLGTLAAGDGSKLVGSGKYVTHTSSGNSSTNIWAFGWTAPQPGTGDVTFYGAIAVSKPVTKLCTLVIPQKNSSLQENEMTRLTLFPIPVGDFLTVNYNPVKDDRFLMELYDLSGHRTAVLVDIRFRAGNNSTTVKIPDQIKNGIYMLRMISIDKIIVNKVVVTR
jgi:hypothetical protein